MVPFTLEIELMLKNVNIHIKGKDIIYNKILNGHTILCVMYDFKYNFTITIQNSDSLDTYIIMDNIKLQDIHIAIDNKLHMLYNKDNSITNNMFLDIILRVNCIFNKYIKDIRILVEKMNVINYKSKNSFAIRYIELLMRTLSTKTIIIDNNIYNYKLITEDNIINISKGNIIYKNKIGDDFYYMVHNNRKLYVFKDDVIFNSIIKYNNITSEQLYSNTKLEHVIT